MKTKILSLFLTFLVIFSLCSCVITPPQPADGTTLSDVTTAAPAETGEINDATSAETTAAPDIPPEIKLAAGTLIYKEDFESRGLSSDSTSVLSTLDWKVQNIVDNAYTNNTSKYSIVNYKSGKGLYIDNNRSNCGDSYVTILNDIQMGYFHESNYTVQYDVEYTDALNTSRYIAIVTDYNGQFYNSFHFRNQGSGNNQCHSNGGWYTYDVEGKNFAADTSASANSIAYKLLGKPVNVNESLFSGVSVSIRYVVDRDNGNSVYMRVNDPTSSSRGQWVLVSLGVSESTNKTYFNTETGGGSIVLKTGGRQNGYIDNIFIWTGTTEAPITSEALVTSSTKECYSHIISKEATCDYSKGCKYCSYIVGEALGHNFVSINGVETCDRCNRTHEAIDNKWLLDNAPVYIGGTKSEALYNVGQGIESVELPLDADDDMQIISSTNPTQFAAYLDKLTAAGYTREFYRENDNNFYASYFKNGNGRIYTYYTAPVREVRVICDTASDSSITDFGYTYTKKAGDETILYQYGVPMGGTYESLDGYINYGMIYIMKLGDGSAMLFDGGGYQMFDNKQIEGLMQFFENNFERGSDGKFRISCWYISHTHQDHMAGLCLFFDKYSSNFNLERIMFNLPSVNEGDPLFVSSRATYTKLLNRVIPKFKNVEFLKLHTGEVVNLADISIEVIYTHEDIVEPKFATTEIKSDFNNSCSVIKLTFDGKTFMFLGDINIPAANVIIANNAAATLKSDIVQIAHHMYNKITFLYQRIQAPVVLVPQDPRIVPNYADMMAVVNSYVKNNMIFYISKQTTGLAVVGGELTVVYTEPVHGGPYTGWTW